MKPPFLWGVLPKWAGRILSFVIGAAIVYHEVILAETSEFLLVIVGLWLMGFPIANVIDSISKLGGGDGRGKDGK